MDVSLTANTLLFQPTSPRGGRLDTQTGKLNISTISTHVPTRGTTPRGIRGHGQRAYFNPRPHAGDDVSFAAARRRSNYFNPRPHAGDDMARSSVNAVAWVFQPTSPRGGRRYRRPQAAGGEDFNPRPHAGDDGNELSGTGYARLFQPTSPRGGRHRGIQGRGIVLYFNPRPHAGDDTLMPESRSLAKGFQPTSPRGGRQLLSAPAPKLALISTHVPTRGTTLRPSVNSVT